MPLPFELNPAINLPELIAYGKSKQVRILLWLTWLAMEQNPHRVNDAGTCWR